MISFDNTEIAFRSKNNKDLQRAFLLFKIIGAPTLVKLGKIITPLALKLKLPIKGLIKRTIFKQFCGGESIEDCHTVIENLNQIKASNWSDFFKQSMKGVQGFGSYTKSAQPVLDALQKFSPYVKMLGYADLSIELIKLITKLGSGSSVDVRDWMTLFSKICQQPPFASLAGPLGPAFIAAGFIAEPLIYPTYDVGLAYENQTESDIKEVESDSISMDHTQWDHWLKISAELRRLEKTLPVIAMRRAILNPILKTKFSSAYREADKIIQDNMNGGRSNTEAIKRTFYPLLHEYFDIKERKYQRTRV